MEPFGGAADFFSEILRRLFFSGMYCALGYFYKFFSRAGGLFFLIFCGGRVFSLENILSEG